MKKLFILIFLLLLIFYKNINAGEKGMFLELKDGVVEIKLRPNKHVSIYLQLFGRRGGTNTHIT